tara:strand:+ start:115 stop:453 length:339 start_codon:yes stop_codon:yes gene_type:complete
MTSNSQSREELRKKLRDKIKNKRNGGDSSANMARTMKKDPQTALMSLGIDDPNILNSANDIVKNPHKLLDELKQELKENIEQTKHETANMDKSNDVANNVDSDDEELPPSML